MRWLILLLVAPLWASAWEANTPAQVGRDTFVSLAKEPAQPAPRLRVTLSRQPVSVLRAVVGNKLPEGAALYTVRVCNLVAMAAEVDPGSVEQGIVGAGIATTSRALAQLAVERSRSRGLSILARIGEVAAIAAPVVVGFAASGAVQLSNWQITGVSGLGAALKIIGDGTEQERGRVRASIGDLGAWLDQMPRMVIDPGQCTPQLLMLGSYDRKRLTEVLEVP